MLLPELKKYFNLTLLCFFDIFHHLFLKIIDNSKLNERRRKKEKILKKNHLYIIEKLNNVEQDYQIQLKFLL